MLRDLFLIAIGAVVMRYVILNTDDYKQKEAEKIDEIRNKVHDLIKKYNPGADNIQVANDVVTNIK